MKIFMRVKLSRMAIFLWFSAFIHLLEDIYFWLYVTSGRSRLAVHKGFPSYQ